MTAYKITTFDSKYSNAGHAFADGSPGADSLTVDQGAYLLARGAGNRGAYLLGPDAWAVTVNGLIFSETEIGLLISNGGAKSSVTIGAEGEIAGFTCGVAALCSVTIKNAGLIQAQAGPAIILQSLGASSISNSGTIAGDIEIDNPFHTATITNSKTIDGSIIFASDSNKVTNTGIIDGSIEFSNGNNVYSATSSASKVLDITAGNGNDIITSAGFMRDIQLGIGDNKITVSAKGSASSIITGFGNDAVSISGSVGEIHLQGGDNKITVASSGSILAGSLGSITMDDGNDVYSNAGTHIGNTSLGGGKNTFTNSGSFVGDLSTGISTDVIKNTKILEGKISLSDGADSLTNSGTITGDISMGSGDDKVTNTGKISFIDLGDGADSYSGSSFVDYVFDTGGADTVKLGAGNDTYDAVGFGGFIDGVDIIDGGTGIDLYLGFPATGDLLINIDTVLHDVAILNSPSVPVAAKTATGTGVGTDIISNFENVFGGEGNDIIFGSAAANELNGWGKNDQLFGFGGNDSLEGGDGLDVLVGGLGADKLRGGAGIDHFTFIATNESGNTKATRDVILDFQDDIDFINVSLIDAYTKNGAIDDAFVYINGNSSTTPSAVFTKVLGQGQLRSYWTADGHIIEGDVNADGKADFSIAVNDPTHAITFTQSDFIVS